MSRTGKHRAPIEMPKDDGKPFSIDRDDLAPATGDASKYHPDGGMRAAVVHHVVTAFLIAMVLAIGTWGYLTFKDAKRPEPGKFSFDAPIFEVAAGDAQLDRFRFALAVYFRLYEKYPPELDALVDEGLLSSKDLNYPRGSSSIVYKRTGDSYQLAIERTIVRKIEDPAELDKLNVDGSAESSTNGSTNSADAQVEEPSNKDDE